MFVFLAEAEMGNFILTQESAPGYTKLKNVHSGKCTRNDPRYRLTERSGISGPDLREL